jgi:inner membrane transporter RhtA
MQPRTAALASVAVVAAQVSINLGAALAKGLFAQLGPEGVAALRTSLAALVLIMVARPWRVIVTPHQALWLGLYGLVLGGMNLLIYWAIERIPLGIAVAIEICGPLAVVLATSRSARDFVWLALAASGLLLLVPWRRTDDALDPLGIAFALGAAACWALYIVFGKRAAKVDSGTAVALGMVMACLVTLPFGIAEAGNRLLQPPLLLGGLIVALLSSALPYFIEMKALDRLSSRVFGMVTSSAPAIAALLGFVVLGEELSWFQVAAIALMISASAGSSLSGHPPVERAREMSSSEG